ncbi:acid phosphatase [Nannizzia gypsea CBS 118893]|uniref:Acid phosphatase n=1 Tax=Arthroderma gypseum (strain ATCC MYA-4604 / CBS 118893) TaxID=535722 RepID=E4UY30_ARTGP|nr:acid phosphatase [Nannizzia gypsea CBS 118893]EFR02023.1 acid phosphatase [Nannizzia gypsea CBS 118893]
MQFRLALSLLPLAVQAANIVSSNDDGWAEVNLHTLYNALTSSGHSVVVSAPADNKSGTGSSDAAPTTRNSPCEFNSCPAGSPAVGYDQNNPRFNYVNSFPVTSMRYGIQTVAPKFFGGRRPDLAVAGPNVGANLGRTVQISGTVGAATEAALEGIPAIAFSGSVGSMTAYWDYTPNYSAVYATLATQVTNALLRGSGPVLPSGVFLNVNFGAVSDYDCTSADDFSFILTRILPTSGNPDVNICGNGGVLPTESDIVKSDGCYVSISVATARGKRDADSSAQEFVLNKLSSILSC